ncbi:hypothetical protein CRN79_15995 [Serratia fonticola]|nr:hypothetical protein CRN79_15995 [Serratia fonticola]
MQMPLSIIIIQIHRQDSCVFLFLVLLFQAELILLSFITHTRLGIIIISGYMMQVLAYGLYGIFTEVKTIMIVVMLQRKV